MEKRVEMERLPPLDEAPWLVCSHPTKSIQTFCTNISHNQETIKSYIKNIPQLKGKCIVATSHRWLILLDMAGAGAFSLWNPVTSETVFLVPPLPGLKWSHEGIVACILTSPPSSDDNSSGRDDCVILVFGLQFIFSLRPGRPGSPRWGVQRLKLLDGKRVQVKEVITCNGVIYAWGDIEDGDYMRTTLFGLEVGDDDLNTVTLRSLELGNPDCGFYYPHQIDYLVECCGLVYLVSMFTRYVQDYERINAVNVWKLDSREMKWVEVDSLGDRAFFLASGTGSTWCWASMNSESREDGVQGNCMYFLTGDHLYLYSLEERSLKLLSPCSQDLETTWNNPTWFIPHHERLLAGKVRTPSNNKNSILDQEISSHELFDHLNFRATSKSIISALPPPLWRTNNSLPLLIYSKNDNGLCKVMDPCRHDSCSIVIPELSRSREVFIDFSKNGWLIIYKGGKTLHFVNPFTRVTGVYPPFDNACSFSCFGFSTSPTSSDCLSIGITAYTTSLKIVYILSGGSWDYEKFDYGEEVFHPPICSPVYHDGAFYVLCKRGHLGKFMLEDGQANWQVYRKPDTPDTHFHTYHLVECDGQLLSVFIGNMGDWVRVFRFNHAKGNWVGIKGLGKHILFVGHSSSFSTVAENRETRNRIYLPRLYDDRIVFYSLDTGKFHAFGTEDSMKNLAGTTEHRTCSWI